MPTTAAGLALVCIPAACGGGERPKESCFFFFVVVFQEVAIDGPIERQIVEIFGIF